MDLALAIVVIVFVVGVLTVLAFALFEISPFARHRDSYRDRTTHRRRYDAPNLEDGHY